MNDKLMKSMLPGDVFRRGRGYTSPEEIEDRLPLKPLFNVGFFHLS